VAGWSRSPLRNQLRIGGYPAFPKSYKFYQMESLGICDRRFLPSTGLLASGPRDPWSVEERSLDGCILGLGLLLTLSDPAVASNNKGPPPPGFFVSVASKGLRFFVSGLESTPAGISISVDSKESYTGQELPKCVCDPWKKRQPHP
jgi:hypothetical protein